MPDRSCPQDEAFRDCLVGKMPLGEAEALLDHLDACPRCQAKFQTVSDIGDTLIDCLRQPWERDEFQDEPQLQEAIARAKAIGAGPGRGGKARGLCEANPDVLGELGEYRFLEKMAEGEEAILAIEGFGRKPLVDAKKKLKALGFELAESAATTEEA